MNKFILFVNNNIKILMEVLFNVKEK